jgi:beta-aspartyl-dipeptidase (metallo-type)
MLTLIENGDIYAPEPKGTKSILLTGNTIARIGDIDRRSVEALGIPLETIDASGCIVAPGLIDPHEHLLGGSGEDGFATQTPWIFLHEIITAGITTVVGCLGVDTTMTTMAGLLARAKGLSEDGLTTFIWSGGYNVPPASIMKSVREDILFIAEVIGAGEIAVADERCTGADPLQLARIVKDTHIGGMLANKAGVTHFHMGDGEQRFALIRQIIEEYEIKAEWIYPTHISRSRELMDEAMALAAQGATIDIDVVEEDLAKWLRYYLDNGGNPDTLTISSDASITSPKNLHEQIRDCIVEHHFPIEQVLALATANTARVLKLERKGKLEEGKDGDILIMKKDSLDIVHLLACGKRMVSDGEPIVSEKYMEQTNRKAEIR